MRQKKKKIAPAVSEFPHSCALHKPSLMCCNQRLSCTNRKWGQTWVKSSIHRGTCSTSRARPSASLLRTIDSRPPPSPCTSLGLPLLFSQQRCDPPAAQAAAAPRARLARDRRWAMLTLGTTGPVWPLPMVEVTGTFSEALCLALDMSKHHWNEVCDCPRDCNQPK